MSGQETARATLQAAIDSFAFHGDSAPALRGVQVEAVPGSLTAVLGGSGSGKSTLGRLLGAWLEGGRDGTLKGTLQLYVGDNTDESRPLVYSGADDDPRIDAAAWADHVGYVPQDAAAMLSAVRGTVEEELAFGLENRGTARADMVRIVAKRPTGPVSPGCWNGTRRSCPGESCGALRSAAPLLQIRAFSFLMNRWHRLTTPGRRH